MTKKTDHNPFSALGLALRYEIPRADIEKAYLLRLAAAHPDSGASVPDPLAPDAPALNEARAILLDAERRAIALLDAMGGPGASESKELPDGFLMDIMARRQEIEEQLGSADEAARRRWEDWARSERARYAKQVSTLFGALDDPPARAQLVEIRTLLNAWRYIERLIEQLDPEYDPDHADFR